MRLNGKGTRKRRHLNGASVEASEELEDFLNEMPSRFP